MATGLWTTKADGSYGQANGLWVTDATGTYKQAVGAWTTDATGTWKKTWPAGSAIQSFTAAAGSPSYNSVALSWTVTGAVSYEIRMLGSSVVLWTGSASSAVLGGLNPNTTYNFTLRAKDASGATTDSPPLSWTTSVLPAPSGFQRTGGDYSQSIWAWNAVPGATGYQLIDTINGNAVIWSGAAAGVTEHGLSGRTVYERAVRTTVGAVSSVIGSKVRYTSPAAPTAAPGSYSFAATSAQTWAPGTARWRPVTDGIFAGNAQYQFGPSEPNGAQVGVAFYGNKPWLVSLAGARCTRFKVSLKRDATSSLAAPQTSYWWLHNYTGRPAGAPTLSSGPLAAGALARGQSGTIDLPVSWGQALLNGQYAGIAWGFTNNNFQRADPVASVPGQLTLYITIG